MANVFFLYLVQFTISNIIVDDEIVCENYCSGKNCSGTLTFTENVRIIQNRAFYGCAKLSGDLIIPDTVTFVGYGAFLDCSGFNGTLSLSNNLTCINESVFSGCYGLTGSLIIPQKVESIGNNAFSGCNKFSKIISVSVKEPHFYSDSFSKYLQQRIKAYVPDNYTKETYCGFKVFVPFILKTIGRPIKSNLPLKYILIAF